MFSSALDLLEGLVLVPDEYVLFFLDFDQLKFIYLENKSAQNARKEPQNARVTIQTKTVQRIVLVSKGNMRNCETSMHIN